MDGNSGMGAKWCGKMGHKKMELLGGEEWSGVRCKIDVGFGRRGYNRMFGFEVVWTIMLHKGFQACAIHLPYKYSSSRHICLHRIRHSSLLQRSIVPF